MGLRILLVFCLVAASMAAHAQSVSVSVSPRNDELAADLRRGSLVAELADADRVAATSEVIAAARADYARLVGVLYADGFFGPTVSIRVDGAEAANLSNFAQTGTIRTVDITVSTGPAFQFGTARIGPITDETVVPDAFASGQPASVAAMRSAVSAGIDGWRAAGHAVADVASQSITARHGQAILDATVTLDPGPMLSFGRLKIEGDTVLSQARLKEIAGFRPGTTFDPAAIADASTRLRRSGVFDVVALSEAEQPNADGTLDIVAQVQDSKPRRFGFGAEVSSREGASLSAFWLHRNILGGGERLRVDAEISGIGGADSGGEDFTLGVDFDRPATFTRVTDLFINAAISSLDEPNFTADKVSLEAGITHRPGNSRQYSYAIGFEGADTTDAFGAGSYRVLTLPLSVQFDRRDNQLSASSGYYFRASATPFYALSGTKSGMRFYADARAYHTVGTDRPVTFAFRGQLGSLTGPSLSTAPADFLFYSGGGGTVRGQTYQSLGVAQPSGRISGGRSFLGLAGEARVQLRDALSVVGFADAGYIGSEEFPDATSGDWHTGAGVGVRYNTGIGPIRVDVGFPLSGPTDANGFELYIGIGQAF